MKNKAFLLVILNLLFGFYSCQKAPEPFLNLDTPSAITFATEGGEQTIKFHTDENWSVDYSGDWLDVSPTKGVFSENGNTISVSCINNGYQASRSSTVTIMTSKCNVSITITQEGDRIISIKDEKFKEYLLSHFDLYPDKEISYTEADQIEVITLPAKNEIKSFDEIESFANLKGVYIHNNHVSKLDFSNNPKLEEIDITDAQLESINIRNCKGLKRVQLSNNRLRSLDLSQNTILHDLSCCNNLLESLDVSNNTKLTFFQCFENQLSSLDVSKNILLEGCECSDNQLTELIMGNNSHLEFLNCKNNQLTTLDVSHLPSLKELECYYNNIESLDLTNNYKLEYVSCFGNPSLASVWIKEGQDIRISYDDLITTIYYK